MKKFTTICLLSAFLFTMQGVSFAQSNTAGKNTRQTRNLSDFNFINLSMSGSVYVKQASEFSVEVEAPADLIDKITTQVSERTLIIDNKNTKMNIGNSGIKIYVTMPNPNGFEVNGSGSITALTPITSNFFVASVSGSGSMKLMDITAKNLKMKVEGSGSFSQTAAKAETSLISVTGSGHYEVDNVTSQVISAVLEGSGSINMHTLAAEKLSMQNGGSGSFRQIGGMATSVLIENRGSGNIGAGELNSSSFSISNAGSGGIDIGHCEVLNVQVAGSGSVHYKGTPKTMRKDVSGSGRVTQN